MGYNECFEGSHNNCPGVKWLTWHISMPHVIKQSGQSSVSILVFRLIDEDALIPSSRIIII